MDRMAIGAERRRRGDWLAALADALDEALPLAEALARDGRGPAGIADEIAAARTRVRWLLANAA